MIGSSGRGPAVVSWLSPWARCVTITVVLASSEARAGEPAASSADPYRSCGLNCLTIIARLHSCDSPHQAIRESLRPRPNGDCSVADIERAATSIGLRPVSVRVAWSRLPDLPTPCIIQVRSPTRYATGSHFLVLMGLHRDGVILLDPPTPSQVHSYEEFQGDWTGVVVAFADDEAGRARLADWLADRSSRYSPATVIALAAVAGGWLLFGRGFRARDVSPDLGQPRPAASGSQGGLR